MFLHKGKCILFLTVVGFFICSQTAIAQKIISGRTALDESSLPKIMTEKFFVANSDLPSENNEPNKSSLIKNDSVETDFRAEIRDIKYQFRKIEMKKRNLDFDDAAEVNLEESAANYSSKKDADLEPRYVRETAKGRGFNYRGALGQSLMFLAVQHGYALTQPKTQEALKHGAFWKDYADSVKSLRGWDDGGRFFTNYLAHPMQGAFTGHIYVQNSPQALREQFSMSGKYWKTRMKALLWTTAWSTQFEIGPISQASIGNVGLKGKQTWEDIVVTPTAGTAMLIGEDAIDQYVIKAIERRTSNLYVKIFARMILNPTRNFSNLLRFREPWYRDRAIAR